MKKLLYIAAIFSFSANVYAQDETTDVLTTEEETVAAAPNLSKNGKQITPEAGDISLGMAATPFLQYLGNALNGENFNAAPNVQGVNNTISVKYFLSESMAARVRINVDQTVRTDREFVLADKQTDLNDWLEDKRIVESSGWNFAAGVEMRRGKGRIQGYYGGEIFINRNNSKTIYEYGNALTQDNQEPNTTGNWGTNTNMNSTSQVNTNGQNIRDNQNNVIGTQPNYERLLSDYQGTTIGFGANGVIGVEYFFAPKISIGGEFTMGPFYSTRTDRERAWEFWGDDGREVRVEVDNGTTQKNRGWNTNSFGNIYLNVHF